MPKDALEHLGNCIRNARNECGLTQQELADQTGKGLRHIQNIEKGRINPSFEVLDALIKRLGISAEILFNPAMAKQDEDIKHFLGKFMSCNEEERAFLLCTMDCMVEQIIKHRQAQPQPQDSE